MVKKVRNVHVNSGYPECPICLDDLVQSLMELSLDCSKLEFYNNDTARKRVVKGIRAHEKLVKQFKERLTVELRIEIAEYLKTEKNDFKGNVDFFKGIKKKK